MRFLMLNHPSLVKSMRLIWWIYWWFDYNKSFSLAFTRDNKNLGSPGRCVLFNHPFLKHRIYFGLDNNEFVIRGKVWEEWRTVYWSGWHTASGSVRDDETFSRPTTSKGYAWMMVYKILTQNNVTVKAW